MSSNKKTIKVESFYLKAILIGFFASLFFVFIIAMSGSFKPTYWPGLSQYDNNDFIIDYEVPVVDVGYSADKYATYVYGDIIPRKGNTLFFARIIISIIALTDSDNTEFLPYFIIPFIIITFGIIFSKKFKVKIE